LGKKRRAEGWKWTLIALIPTVIIILPVYFIAIGGFQTVAEIFHRPPYWFPPNPTLEFYTDAWVSLLPYLKNSLIIALGNLVLTLAVALPSAFALAKFHLKLGKPTFFILAFTQMLPATAVVIPLFLMFIKLKLINNYFSVILGIAVFTIPFATIVLRAYIQSIPTGLIEAALIDGASLFRVFRSIIVPLSSPAIATTGILTFIMAWGDFIVSLSFLNDQAMQPMSIGLYHFVSRYGVEWSKLMAGSMIFAIPLLIVALLAGKSIVTGLTAGAFKE
jgi:multiple sugar transport system permease protein